MELDSGDDDDRKPSATGSTTPPKKVKPALKKKPKSKSGPQHLKWDEAAIEEHDLLRGTRMKIDEPNTPYTHYDSGAESDDSRRPKSPAHQKDSISWDNLQNRLDTVAAVQDSFPNDPSADADTDQSDVEPEHRKEMRDLEFREHRKRHYNEMELVKKFRQEHPDGASTEKNGDDDEADDADDET
jgi:protein phosphatase inhibitor 2